MGEKLTRPQAELLAEIGTAPQKRVKTHKPAGKLVGLGYATWIDNPYFGRSTLHITPAGRDALARHDGGTDER